jgi:hypothetical protein
VNKIGNFSESDLTVGKPEKGIFGRFWSNKMVVLETILKMIISVRNLSIFFQKKIDIIDRSRLEETQEAQILKLDLLSFQPAQLGLMASTFLVSQDWPPHCHRHHHSHNNAAP